MDQTVLRASDDSWQPTGVPGIAVRRLGSDPASRRETFLLKFEAGAELPDHRHSQTEECFVLEGTIRTRGTVLQAGDFLRLPEGTMHGSSISDSGCIVLISAGMVEAPAAQSGA
jgi:anti-sigma factor ChrR (cupin superfamily)